MIGISSMGTHLSAIDLLAKKFASTNAKPRTSEDVILDKIRQNDPKKADALKEQLENSKQIAARLRNSKGDASKLRKAAAAEKVKRIKEQIQILKTMGGDPRLVARQIAALAKELAAAAREYSFPSQGSTALMDATTSTSGNNAATLNTVENSTTDSGTAMPAGASAATVAGETSAPVGKNEKSEDAAQEQGATSTTTTGAALAEDSRQYQETQLHKFKDDLQKNIEKIHENSSETEADRRFVNEVRALASRLKELAKQVKQRLHQTGDHIVNQDINQTTQALAEVEKSISDITGNNAAAISVFA